MTEINHERPEGESERITKYVLRALNDRRMRPIVEAIYDSRSGLTLIDATGDTFRVVKKECVGNVVANVLDAVKFKDIDVLLAIAKRKRPFTITRVGRTGFTVHYS